MSPALRLRRLDALLQLLTQGRRASGTRVDAALDGLLDASPALAAAAYARAPIRLVASRRLEGRGDEETSSLSASLLPLAERVFTSGNAKRFELPRDLPPVDAVRWGASGARAAFGLPLRVTDVVAFAVVLPLPDAATLDEETLRFFESIARATELALERDRAQSAAERLAPALSELERLGEQCDALAELTRKLELLGDPSDLELGRRLNEATRRVQELAAGTDRIRGALGEPTESARLVQASGIRSKVLLIDDDPVFARALRRSLAFHELRLAETASEAEIALLDETYEPDLVVCDVSLPGANGDVLHARIAQRRPGLAARFVFVTGGALDDGVASYLERSRCPTLFKPFDLESLERFLRDAGGGAASPTRPARAGSRD